MEWLSWRHGLEFLRDSTGTIPEVMVSVPTVAPLGTSIDIDDCLNEYEKGLSDIVITVTRAHRNPHFNMVRTNPDGSYGLANSVNSGITRRQDAPTVYDMATICYVANSEFVMTHESIFEGRVGAVHVPIERAIDIDTLLDFKVAEYLLNLKEQHE